jgi:hypothetical protein
MREHTHTHTHHTHTHTHTHSHENEDIAAATTELLQEMTDADTLDGEEEHALAWVDALLTAQLMPTLVEAFARLKDSEEANGVSAIAQL